MAQISHPAQDWVVLTAVVDEGCPSVMFKMRLVLHTAHRAHHGEWIGVCGDPDRAGLEHDLLSAVADRATAGEVMWLLHIDNDRYRAIPFTAIEWIEVEFSEYN